MEGRAGAAGGVGAGGPARASEGGRRGGEAPPAAPVCPRGPGVGGRRPGVSGRREGRGGAAHLVAEESREAALGGGGARRREAANVPEAQRAVVRGGVEHLAVHLRARGVGGRRRGSRAAPTRLPPAAPGSPGRGPRSPGRPRPGRLCPRARAAARDGGVGGPSALPFRGRATNHCQPAAGPGEGGAPTWMQLMTKAWPRNTLRSAPDWASKARARASPLPVNTVDTRRRWPRALVPSGLRGAGVGAWTGGGTESDGDPLLAPPLASQGCRNCKWQTTQAP